MTEFLRDLTLVDDNVGEPSDVNLENDLEKLKLFLFRFRGIYTRKTKQ